MPVLKVWSEDKLTKVCVVIENFNVAEILRAASAKGINGTNLFLMDGTLIDEDMLVEMFHKEIFVVGTDKTMQIDVGSPSVSDTSISETGTSSSSNGKYKEAGVSWAQNLPISWHRLSEQEVKLLEDSEHIKNTTLNHLVRIVVDDIFTITKDPGRQNLRILAKRICAKFTVLLDTDDDDILIGEGYNSIFKKIEDHLQYRKRPHKNTQDNSPLSSIKKSGRIIKSYRKAGCSHWQPSVALDSDTTEEEIKDFLKQQILLTPDKRNESLIEKYLEETYPIQRLFLNNESPPTVNMMVDNWPILFEQKYAFWHFNKLMETDIKSKSDILENKCYKILSYFSAQTNKTIQDIIEEDLDPLLKTLKLLTTYFKENCAELFLKLEESCTQEDGLRASATSSPFLLIIGSNMYIVIENKIVCHVNTIKDAVGIIYAFYYNFNMAYSQNAIMTLEFIQRYIYKINPVTGSKAISDKKAKTNSILNKVLSLIIKIKNYPETSNKILMNRSFHV